MTLATSEWLAQDMPQATKDYLGFDGQDTIDVAVSVTAINLALDRGARELDKITERPDWPVRGIVRIAQ